MADYSQETVAFLREHKNLWPQLEDPEKAKVYNDMQSIGLSDSQMRFVDVVKNGSQLQRIVELRINEGENFLIIGASGGGKTQIIRAAAAKFNYRIEEFSLSSHLPEDLGGIPMTIKTEWPKEKQLQYIADKLVEDEVEERLKQETKGAPISYAKRLLLKNRLGRIVRSEQKITPEEVEAVYDEMTRASGTGDPEALKIMGRFDYEQRVARPEWVGRIMDTYLYKKQKTVVFFDEVNQGRGDITNTLFKFLQTKKFGDEDRYDMSDSIQCFAGAGNYQNDNDNITEMGKALVDRFKKVIYYFAEFNDSWEYIKDLYLQTSKETPCLAQFLVSVNPDEMKDSVLTNRSAEDVVQMMQKMELRVVDAGSWSAAYSDTGEDRISGLGFNPSGMTTGLKKDIEIFLADLGAPFYAAKAGKVKQVSAQRELINVRTLSQFWPMLCKAAPGTSVTWSQLGKSYQNTNEDKLRLWEDMKAKWGDIINQETLNLAKSDPRSGETAYTVLKALGAPGLPTK